MLVYEEALGGASLRLPSETRGNQSLVHAPNQNVSSPYLSEESQDDPSLVFSTPNPICSPTILAPIDETLDGSSPSSPANALDALDGSSSIPMQRETLDDHLNFSICNEEALAVDPVPSSPNRLLGNNLGDYSSSRGSSSHCSSAWKSPWPSTSTRSSSRSPPKETRSSSRETSSTSSSEETRPSSSLLFSTRDLERFSVGAGLANLGNTCFMNAVLQCFTHTVPLVQALRSYNHAMPCDSGTEGFCVVCALRDHVDHSLASSGEILSPFKLVNNLNYFSSCFQRYQQEDAHEFLQCFLDKLERCLDLRAKDKSPVSQNNNLVERVFGGRLVSKLRCCNCGHSSDTYEPLIDLSLEIEDVDSLPSALDSFTKVEKIEDSEAKFMCENCKEEVFVEKQFMVDQAPSIAAFHLKRFKSDGSFVEKVDKHVEFPLELDLYPYSTGCQNNNVELKYNLYAIVVHIGLSSTSGHYFCFIRSSPERWHKLDDSKVTSVREEFVLSQEAYILFYAREGTPWVSSLMGELKLCLAPNILNTLPNSVLDNMDSDSAENLTVATIGNCIVNESRDAAEGTRNEGVEVNEVRDTAAGSSSHLLHRSKEDELRSNDSNDVVPMDNTSTPLGTSSLQNGSLYTKGKMCSASSPEGNDCQKEINETKEDGFDSLTPPRSPSPDMVSLEYPDKSYHIPRDHLKLEEEVSCRKRFNKPLEDSKRKEAVRYLSKSVPHSRGMKLIAAMLGNRSDGSVNKRKRMVSSPCKNGPPSARRRKPNHDSVVHSVATGITQP